MGYVNQLISCFVIPADRLFMGGRLRSVLGLCRPVELDPAACALLSGAADRGDLELRFPSDGLGQAVSDGARLDQDHQWIGGSRVHDRLRLFGVAMIRLRHGLAGPQSLVAVGARPTCLVSGQLS